MKWNQPKDTTGRYRRKWCLNGPRGTCKEVWVQTKKTCSGKGNIWSSLQRNSKSPDLDPSTKRDNETGIQTETEQFGAVVKTLKK